MIYVQQPELPISYIQLYFTHQSDHLFVGSQNRSKGPPNCPSVALRVLAQRQVLRGTKRAHRNQFISQIENLGTEIQLTQRSYAQSVGAVILTRTIEHFLPLLSEALTQPLLDKGEIEQSKRAYIAELKARYDEDHSLAWLWLSRRLHHEHPLWSYYTVEAKDIETLGSHDIEEAWSQVFSKTTLLPCVTSNLEHDRVKELINKLSIQLPDLTSLVSSPAPVLPPLTKRLANTLSLVHKPNKKQALLFIAHPTLPPQHPQFLALQVALCALGGTFSSPLMYEIRTKRSLSYGAYAGIKGEGQARFICFHATPDAQQALETLEVMLAVYQQGMNGQLSNEQIQFAKDYLCNAHPFSIETPAMRAALRANAKLMGMDADKLLQLPKWLTPLSVEEIKKAAQDHLSLSGLEILIFGDQDKGLKGIEKQVAQLIHIDQVQQFSASAPVSILE